MNTPFAIRRRRRLHDKLDRAFWRTWRIAMSRMAQGDFAEARRYEGVNDDIHQALLSLAKGDLR